ncbi:MAG: hypothetical protein UT42_C0003G0003 [Candidatus Falkowbacteria bacterium GW2011_GWA2_39_24]|uniref:ATP-grasp domain-containing protein n=1 Tax=Candidatus Falkowbacteria bacterium GW2011_GWA2_39_24 TaxID=1618634 RepID=A0A0G0NRG2_9BACT|nr:MAG: hypothetical protein UT42_C0003G0003 [Candidatus Falkowbacteria bacterium GW2011_GWA2_39_24]
MQKRNTVLFIDHISLTASQSISDYNRKIKDQDSQLKIAVIRDARSNRQQKTDFDYIVCDFSKPLRLAKALAPYQEKLLAVTCTGDKNIADFAKVIPYVPYLRTPTEKSLQWSVDKVAMRQHFLNYDKKISPNFLVVTDDSKETIKKIKKEIRFPLVIKPASLGASIWVTNCFHEEELIQSLHKIFKHLHIAYKKDKRAEIPKILVEEFMEGTLYSIDAYVSSRGTITFCPMVQVKTGKEIGFDDFFGYQQMTPTTLKQKSIEAAQEVAAKGIHALNLRSTSAHVEIIKTEDGFKIVEIGPRIGGFRHYLYELSYGMDHSLNDIFIRVPTKIRVPKKVKGYSVAMKFFAKKEGRLKKLSGAKKIKELASYSKLTINKKPGDMCHYAKNGGRSVCNLTMFNPSRSELLADIRRAESHLKIIT